MITVGITGGIGSGKTTVCKRWEKRGAFVVYADALAKQLMVEDEELKMQLIDAFGNQTYLSDGSLNRAYLTQEAFQKGRVQTLNKLVHPKVHKATHQLISRAEQEGYELFVYEAALLLDHGRPDYFDAIVLVLADEDIRIARVAKRDQQDESVVRSKIDRQNDFRKLIKWADYVIMNDGSLQELIGKSDILYNKLKQMGS